MSVHEIAEPFSDLKMLPWMRIARERFTPIVLRDYIYVVGGDCDNDLTPNGELKLFDDEYIPIRIKQPYLNERYFIRKYFQFCEAQLNFIFCFSFNIERKEWSFIAAMNIYRFAYGIAILNGLIYVAGGLCNNQTPLKSVECFDPIADQWKFIADMGSERCYFSLVEFQGLLYAIGGGPGKSIECYDPKTDKWTVVGRDYRYELFSHSIIAQNEIFAIGQQSTNEKIPGCVNYMYAIGYRENLNRYHFFRRN